MTSRARAFGVTVAMIVTVVATTPVGRTAQQADTPSNPLAATPGAAAEGQRVYDRACQSCHGPAGLGDRGPALTTGAFVHGREDADLFHTIREGVAGTQMPPFRNLTDPQTWQLVAY